MTMRIEAKIVAPVMEPEDFSKISMYGYLVGVSNALSTSFKLKSVIINMLKPKLPLIKMVNMIERGTMTEAFLISSDI